jgi:hypothetical protein
MPLRPLDLVRTLEREMNSHTQFEQSTCLPHSNSGLAGNCISLPSPHRVVPRARWATSLSVLPP